jgi:hypothetical protein
MPRTLPAIAVFALALPVGADPGFDFFEKKVRPLLAERCLECHSPAKKVKGGLRLDTKEGWATGGDSGPALVPGDLEKSLLIEAVRYGNQDLQMPPKKKLAAEEIAILEQWVKSGANDPRTGEAVAKKQTGLSIEEGKKFWCYAPLSKAEPPATKDLAWGRNGIDRFILAKAEAAGAKPAPDAAPTTLARRLYYTLAGLPPSPEQIDAFVAASARNPKQALENLVAELLASPRFGEAWGRHWLDVARFAESSGGGRTLLFKDAWRYRDYVIEAFNADVPFDRFIREQLAGDLLPAAAPADRRRQLAATAFLALGPTNYEEQDKQQLRYDIIDEQLDTMGRAFLGQTIGCARCHDHKFDPIPQRDYYALAGIFASTRTLHNYTDNVARWIVTPMPGDGADEEKLRAHEAKVAALEKDIEGAKKELTEASKAVTQATTAPGKSIAAHELPGIVIDDSEAKVVGPWKHSKHVRTFIGEGYLTDDNTGKGEKTLTFTPVIPQTGRFELRLAYTHLANRANNVRVSILHADGEDAIFVDQTQPPPIDGRFVSLGKFRFEKDGAGYVLVSNDSTKGYVTIDAVQLLPEAAAAAAVATTDAQKDAARDVAKDDDTAPAREALAKHVKKLEAELKALKKDGPARENAMTVQDDDQPADTQIRVRGVEKQRGETVPRGVLQVALSGPSPALSQGESGRRELADWIAGPQNPLTARVYVNRVWTWLFGAGLVRTVDNFGTTGEKPSHPELLDYLASRFMTEGWSTKRLIREIVLSRTWQQAATAPSASDPDNRLWTHANRRRLDAEQIRDTLLAVSGQLNLDYLGPNIAGAGEIDANNFSAQNIEYAYVYADTRRSVYTPAFRNKRLELFEVFDFADANQPIGQRHASTVAPQALYMLNHPFVLEQAKAAAEKLVAMKGTNEERITAAFRNTLGRAPTAAEMEKCAKYISDATTQPLEAWTQLQHTLFACLDFRYVD